MQFDTKNQSFRDLMGNGLKYRVPKFQRDYSWTEEQWYDLWQDIVSLSESDKKMHYMGYLVLQSADDNTNFTIIDGQQRMTTISIIVFSALYKLNELVLNNIDAEKNRERIKALKNSFIGSKNPVSLQVENKLTINRNNRRIFETYLCNLQDPPLRKIKYSEKLIGEALKYFKDNLFNNCDTGEKIAEKIESIAKNLNFTTITVGSTANAYTVFETLNARGVQLSTPDLVKNYIFSLIDDSGIHDLELEKLEDRWADIISQLGRHKFSHFIKVDWNSRNDFTRGSALFKNIKSGLKNKEQAVEYLNYLQKNSEIYSAFQDYNDEFWRQKKNGQYNNIKLKMSLQMLNLFKIVAPQSILISAFHKFTPEDFIKLLYYIEVVSIRYNIICNKLPGEQERVYCKLARAIENASAKLKEILTSLKQIYPSDEEFVHAFQIKTFKTGSKNKKARYILYRIEEHLSQGDNGKLDLDSVTVEHILPKNPTEGWIKSFEDSEQAEDYLGRIGNLTLLSRENNKLINRSNFDTKKQTFAKSKLRITKKCAEYGEWNEHSISEHQKWLAEQAKEIWKLPVDFVKDI